MRPGYERFVAPSIRAPVPCPVVRVRHGTAVVVAFLALPAGAEATPGTLDLRELIDRSRGPYVEGSVSYVRVRSSDGRPVVARRVRKPRFRMQRQLAPGRYRVISYQRPCDGNCGLLDPPTDRCARPVRVLSGGLTEVAVRVRPGRGCTMSRRALPARFPPIRRLRAVQAWLRSRGGVNSWALIDSWGRLHGFALHRTYVSASLVNAMLLVAYLRGIGNRAPDAGERASLGPMITVSSNDAADTIYYRVGDAALYRLARLAGMRSFSVAGYWGNAHFSAEDQARFFNRIDRLVPRASRPYARGLLSSIVSYQRWGFSRYSLAVGFRTFFKGGWRGTGAGQLVHEAALFERGPTRISMAVLTDGNPSHEYGTETLRGVAQRVFVRRRRARAMTVRPPAKPAQSNASGRILRNRLRLKSAMERFGFSGYLNEWWHFEHYLRPNRYLDLTLGC
jgi:Beta-lactamase enzyme family